MRGTLTIPLGKADAHGYGSAVTYSRRFALAAFVGVAPEDDDGNAAAAAAPRVQRPAPVAPPEMPSGGRKSSAQAKRDGDHDRIVGEINRLSKEGLADWLANFDDLTADQPLSWLDPYRDKLELRRQELFDGEAAD
jgi:hypothetical protein